MEKNEIHAPISPESIISRRISYLIEHQKVIHAQPLRKHGGEIIVMEVPNSLAGKVVHQLGLPKHCTCFGLQRGDSVMTITGKTPFAEGDIICLYCHSNEDAKQALRALS